MTTLYNDFSDTTGLDVEGTAQSNNGALQLTDISGYYEAGEAFTTTALDVSHFATHFQIQVTANSTAADGLAFVLRAAAGAVGNDADQLGYGGIDHSLAIAFDTYNDTGAYIDTDGVVHAGPSDTTVNVADGKVWDVWVEYDGTTLQVRYSEDGLRPADAQLSEAIDLKSVLGTDTAYAGFTAATGGFNQTADILNWRFDAADSSTFYGNTATTLTDVTNHQAIVTGDGDDVITVTDGTNVIYTGAGNDTVILDTFGYNVVDGGSGTDTLDLVGFNNFAFSIDMTTGKTDYTQESYTGFENLLGSDTDNTITGTAGNNVIDASGGNDTVHGGDGDDTIHGGDGNDILAGDNGVNMVFGDAGDDTLIGGGNAADTLNGGDGNDTIDYSTVTSFAGFTLTVDLTAGYAGYFPPSNAGNDKLVSVENAIGGQGSDIMIGTAGNNLLNGGAGNDTMTGGKGDDTYVVDSAGDKVTELNNGGTDTVMSSVDFVIAGYVENVTLTGTDNIKAVGNGENNILTGNSGNNILNGIQGADTMIGGAGNDTYYVENPGDVVTENTNEGADVIYSAVTYSLPANVETLILTGYNVINATGNGLNNTITGNNADNVIRGGDGNDILRGMGGNDTLIGGAGNDSFVFQAPGGNNGLDHISDFVSGSDKLIFHAADFGFTANHHLTGDEFHLNGRSGTNGQFIYNTSNHTLYWDPDGTGPTGAASIAVFDNSATLHATDFGFV